MVRKLDEEFKLFLRWRGLNIDSGLFNLTFNPPQNFAAYRQSELDTARMSSFTAIEAYPYMSKRFAMERFLGLTEEEINKNEKMWREENGKDAELEPESSDLRNIGISAGDIDADLETADSLENQPEEGAEAGPEVAGAVTDAGNTPGGMPAPTGNAM
jgi:hypothetical protein